MAMQTMRVLMLTSTLPRFKGDMQANFVGEQAQAWLDARPDAHITILAPHAPEAAEIEERGRLTIRRFRYMRPERFQGLAYPAILPNIKRNPTLAAQVPLYLIAQARAALSLCKTERFDCIYAHWVMPQGLVARFVSMRTDIPYILQTHSSDLTVFSKAGSVGKAFAARLLKDAARFFCVNSGQLNVALSFVPESERTQLAAKSCVLPMGVARLTGAKVTFDGPEIGTIGRLSRKKGLDLLIAAAERLSDRGVRPRIAIAGDGEESAALKSIVDASDTRFLGFVAGEAKERFLASTARFAFPAKAYGGDVEGLPVALLEALMRGQPVLATRDTNIELLPEWPHIREDVVFVVDPADIEALSIGLQDLLAREPGSAKNSAEVVSRYLWEHLIEEYLEPIEAAVS